MISPRHTLMLPMLTLKSLGGKPNIGIEEPGAVTDRIPSKLAQAKTGSQRRYVSTKTIDPATRTLHHPANTLGSFNYRLQSRRRKKSQRSDPEKRLLLAFWPTLEWWPPLKAGSVYRCKVEQYYAKSERIRSGKAIMCSSSFTIV